MTMSIESNRKFRNSDLCKELVGLHLAPIEGYEKTPLVSLNEVIKSISKFFTIQIQDYVDHAIKNCQESASIYLYTMQIHGLSIESVSFCTTNSEVLKFEEFLDENGLRTMFSIECINGKSIINHSYYKDKEQEVLLLPMDPISK